MTGANKKAPIGRIGQSTPDRVFDGFNVAIMVMLCAIFIWPLLFVLSASFSDPAAVWNGKVILFPVDFNLDCYRAILSYSYIWVGYRNTIFYTVVGTTLNLVMTVCAAYPLSQKNFMSRNFFTAIFVFTMYFGGGLIPTYLVVQQLGLINSFWSQILPSAVSIFNILITRTYFQTSIPESLSEAAELDGANQLQYVARIVLPLSAPILAVMTLYYGVGRWNEFFSALLYITEQDKYPLQMFLRDILIQSKFDSSLMMGMDATQAAEKARLQQTIKYGVIVVASLPLLVAYPFVQKYFVKGVMIGAIKG